MGQISRLTITDTLGNFPYAGHYPPFAARGACSLAMGSYAQHQQDTCAGRRHHSRLRVRLPARLILLEGTLHVTLVDLSYKGAKVECGTALPTRGDAILSWGLFEAFGAVKWSCDNRCGLKFDVPLTSAVLIATRDLADASIPADPRRTAARDFVRGAIRL